MKTNLELFEYSKNHPEEMFDSFYEKNILVIPSTKEEENLLTKNNGKLINLISAFSVLDGYNLDRNDKNIIKIIDDIIYILDNTPNINYSSFSQFFMVYNLSFSIYKSKSFEQKEELIYKILKLYCKERHNMYLSYGYSNTILQVMSDNYSSRRNSKSGIEKVLKILEPYSLEIINSFSDLLIKDDYYFLPDKGGKDIFEYFLKKLNLKMESRKIEQNKLPDIVFKHNNNYFVCELKSMKEGGGGQNKQIVEIANFINFSEFDKNIHYIAFLDCNYANIIFCDNSPKVVQQRKDIINALKNNSTNYFLNTAGMKEFFKELFIQT